MSHNNYNNHPRSSRPSHTSGDSHSGPFLEQGRAITLPPLTKILLPISDSPVSGNYSSSYPNQHRSTPPYDPQYYTSTTQQQAHAGYVQPGYHQYQQLPDSRYPSGQAAHGSYYRSSPSSSSADPPRPQVRRLDVPAPPQGSQYYQQPHTNADLQMSSIPGDIRSPHLYSSPTANYPQYQSLHTSAPYSSNSSRPISVTPQANMYYHQSPSMPTHSSVERTMPSSRSTQPYPRNAPPPSPVEDDLSARSAAESIIKKKRKRADAHQLAVLNATYERTAFPSTEERAALAKQLDMSPRSVQIWFQNKRQAMRQGGRATTSGSNTAPNPGPVPVPTPTPPAGVRYHAASPSIMSPTVQQSGPQYTSRSPPLVGRTGTPSPPSGRSRHDTGIDPRTGRPWGQRTY